MLQAARRAKALLADSSFADLPGARAAPDRAAGVADFLRRRQRPDGGFANRSGRSDLYYAVFGLQGLLALGAQFDAGGAIGYLRRFGDGEGLDLVHLACLVRAWRCLRDAAAAPAGLDPVATVGRLEGFRAADGGYGHQPGSPRGSIYGSFLALGALQDLGAEPPDPAGLVRCVEACRAPDGGYANEPGLPMSLVPATAAAVAVLHELGRAVAPAAAEWLIARHAAAGGFRAAGSPNAANDSGAGDFAPAPDLLSTATALHALGTLGVDLSGIRDACRSFILSLQSPAGGFAGQAGDDRPDCEYTFYALLALGWLA